MPRRCISRTDEQIGKMLMEGGFLSQEQLASALSDAEAAGKAMRDVLAEKGFVNPETYTTFLSLQTRAPIVDLQQVQIHQEAITLVPEDVARQYNVLPLSIEGDTLRVAMDNPQDTDAINCHQRSDHGHEHADPAPHPSDGWYREGSGPVLQSNPQSGQRPPQHSGRTGTCTRS